MIKKMGILGITFMIFTIGLLIIVGYTRTHYDKPQNVYQVYLDSKKIGLLDSKKDLLDIIDKTQENIKKRFNVDKVYPPDGLDIEKIYTYNNNIVSEKEIFLAAISA